MNIPNEDQIQIDRRKFITSIGLAGVITGLSPLEVFSEPKPLLKAAPGNMKCKPYLQAAKTDAMTVRWITDAPCHSWVEYGESRENLHLKAQQIEEGMVQVDNTIHAIILSDLLPGKTYYYRAVSRKTESMVRKKQAFAETVYSDVYLFTTPSENEHIASIEFLVFNDIHDRPESFATLMQYQGAGKKDFVFLNGDMFNSQENEDQIIKHLIDPLTSLFATSTPFLFGRGNHETHGGYARQLGDYFDGRKNKYYYAFQYGPMYALVLDSGETKSDLDPANAGVVDFDAYREKQAQWLEKEVQKSAFKKASYRVVFVHIPAYYLGAEAGAHASDQYNKIWGPIFNSSKIDLMLCGHTHKHGVHPAVPGEHNYPIVIGGGPKDGKRTIINIKVTKKSLNLKMTNDLGKVVGTLEL
jgi:predicted MPP superfamily phosphohydrolase